MVARESLSSRPPADQCALKTSGRYCHKSAAIHLASSAAKPPPPRPCIFVYILASLGVLTEGRKEMWTKLHSVSYWKERWKLNLLNCVPSVIVRNRQNCVGRLSTDTVVTSGSWVYKIYVPSVIVQNVEKTVFKFRTIVCRPTCNVGR